MSGPDRPGSVMGIVMMGADSPHTPTSEGSAAAPEGTPPRRIDYQFHKKGNLPSEGPARRPSDFEQKRGGGGIAIGSQKYVVISTIVFERNYLISL